MNDVSADAIQTMGKALEARMFSELATSPVVAFDDLLELKNLRGEHTGYVKVYTGKHLNRASSLSIDIMPGARYFNIHIIPEDRYDIPRFLFEGMLMGHGSQVSAEVFPDRDIELDYDGFSKAYSGFESIYEELRQDERYMLRPSRLAHMRAFSSPYFLLAYSVPVTDLAGFEEYVDRYFDEWLKLYRGARRLDDAETESRKRRRLNMVHAVRDRDPDRHMVVDVYGEAMTQAMEEASML